MSKNRISSHFISRLKQRYGIEATKDECGKILNDIDQNNCFLIKEMRNDAYLYLVEFMRKDLYLLMNPKTRKLITAITKNQAQKYWSQDFVCVYRTM
jgi:hypothetical protein